MIITDGPRPGPGFGGIDTGAEAILVFGRRADKIEFLATWRLKDYEDRKKIAFSWVSSHDFDEVIVMRGTIAYRAWKKED